MTIGTELNEIQIAIDVFLLLVLYVGSVCGAGIICGIIYDYVYGKYFRS